MSVRLRATDRRAQSTVISRFGPVKWALAHPETALPPQSDRVAALRPSLPTMLGVRRRFGTCPSGQLADILKNLVDFADYFDSVD